MAKEMERFMRVAICDGEKEFTAQFRKWMGRDSQKKEYDVTILEFQSGEEVMEAVRNGNDIDVLFLDIKILDGDGFETARQMRDMGCRCLMIFLTSLFSCIQREYEVKAFRCLLREQLEGQLGKVMDDCRAELLTRDFYSFSHDGKMEQVPKEDILYFESEKSLLYLNTQKAVYCFQGKLDDLERELRESGFLRCHKNFLVQECYVRGWKDQLLRMENGAKIPIGRSFEKEVNRRLAMRQGR